MNKSILLFILFLVAAQAASGQKITLYKTLGGVRYTQDDTLLSEYQVSMILFKDNKEAYQELKKAKKLNTLSSIFGFAGGALIAIPVVTAALGGTPEWGLAVGGAGLLVASIPINRAYKARALHALDIYNNESPTGRIKPEFQFMGNRAGFVLKF
jgi:hypothetical protein